MELVIVDRFPKEFRRKVVQSLDRDLLVILFLTIFMVHAFLLYLIYTLPIETRPETMQRYQKKYADFILSRETTTAKIPAEKLATVPAVEPSRQGSLRSLAELGGASATAGRGGAGRGGGSGSSAFSGAESRLPTTGEMATAGRRGGGGYYSGGGMEAAAGNVSSVGVLGVLTSGSGYGTGDYVDGLDREAGAQSQQLEDVLAGLDGVKVGQYSETGGIAGHGGGGRGGDDILGGRALRGSRRQARALSIDDLLGSLQPTAKVQFKDTDRNTAFEKISDNIQQKPVAPTTPEEHARLARTPQQVQGVLSGHRLAIMDCYKFLLRTQPNVKGKVEIRFAIDPDGRVIWADVADATIKDEQMLACILNRVRQWNDFGYGDPTVPEQIFRQTYTFGY
jgi:hypothetical protein